MTPTQERQLGEAAMHYAHAPGRPGYDPAIYKAFIEGAYYILNQQDASQNHPQCKEKN